MEIARWGVMYTLGSLYRSLELLDFSLDLVIALTCLLVLLYVLLVFDLHNTGRVAILPANLNLSLPIIFTLGVVSTAITAAGPAGGVWSSLFILLTVTLALFEVSYVKLLSPSVTNFFSLIDDEKGSVFFLKQFWHLTNLLPILLWAKRLLTMLNRLELGTRAKLINIHLTYQDLWFNKRHRRARKKIRKTLETPIRIRRYWYLSIKLGARFAVSWLGIPLKQHPQFKPANTLVGFISKHVRRLFHKFLNLWGVAFVWVEIKALGRELVIVSKDLWNRRPSVIQSFIDVFQPEAPVYFRKGFRIVPPAKYPRLINVFSDMETFASRGSSLLVFMFLIWSFFARILLMFLVVSLF